MQLGAERFPSFVRVLLAYIKIDFQPRWSPSRGGVFFASTVAVVGSLVAD